MQEVEGLEAKLSASQHREAAARNELQASKLAFTQVCDFSRELMLQYAP